MATSIRRQATRANLSILRLAKQTASVPRRKNNALHREAIGGVAKSLAEIRPFTRDHEALNLPVIARSAAIAAATARRCLLTLEHLGYVRRNRATVPAAIAGPGAVLGCSTEYVQPLQVDHEDKALTGRLTMFQQSVNRSPETWPAFPGCH
jgi:hypothetical protein